MKEEIKEMRIKLLINEFKKIAGFNEYEISFYLATNYGILSENVMDVTTIVDGTLPPILNIKYKEIQWESIKVK